MRVGRLTTVDAQHQIDAALIFKDKSSEREKWQAHERRVVMHMEGGINSTRVHICCQVRKRGSPVLSLKNVWTFELYRQYVECVYKKWR